MIDQHFITGEELLFHIRSRSDIAEETIVGRDAIQAWRRRWGMTVGVWNDGDPDNNGVYLLRRGLVSNEIMDNGNWDKILTSSEGANTFIELTDTPEDYTGHGGKAVAVKETEDGLEFVDFPDGGVIPVDDILDWDTDAYKPYSAAAAGVFDNSSIAPTATDRLNWGGRFYATQFRATGETVEVAAKGRYVRYLTDANGSHLFHFQTHRWDGSAFIGSTGLAFGYNAGYQNTGSNQSTFGNYAGYQNTGSSQSVFGASAGYLNTGSSQSAFGASAGQQNTGSSQSAFGNYAGHQNTGGGQSAFGVNAGRQNTGSSQSAFGNYAGHQNTGSSQSTFGNYAGYQNTGSSQSVFGVNAGYLNTGSSQSAFGVNAGRQNTGDNQSAFGNSSGYQNTGSSQSAFGINAGYLNTGNNQSAFGVSSGQQNTGDSQSAFGNSSGYQNTGSSQSAFGINSGFHNVGSHHNTFGADSGGYNNWNFRTSLGSKASLQTEWINDASTTKAFDDTDINTTTNEWTITAHGFGSNGAYVNLRFNVTSGSAKSGYSNNTIYRFLIVDANTLSRSVSGEQTGNYTLTKDVDRSNSTALGYNAVATKSNQIVLGNDNVTEVYSAGDFKTPGALRMKDSNDVWYIITVNTSGSLVVTPE